MPQLPVTPVRNTISPTVRQPDIPVLDAASNALGNLGRAVGRGIEGIERSGRQADAREVKRRLDLAAARLHADRGVIEEKAAATMAGEFGQEMFFTHRFRKASDSIGKNLNLSDNEDYQRLVEMNRIRGVGAAHNNGFASDQILAVKQEQLAVNDWSAHYADRPGDFDELQLGVSAMHDMVENGPLGTTRAASIRKQEVQADLERRWAAEYIQSDPFSARAALDDLTAISGDDKARLNSAIDSQIRVEQKILLNRVSNVVEEYFRGENPGASVPNKEYINRVMGSEASNVHRRLKGAAAVGERIQSFARRPMSSIEEEATQVREAGASADVINAFDTAMDAEARRRNERPDSVVESFHDNPLVTAAYGKVNSFVDVITTEGGLTAEGAREIVQSGLESITQVASASAEVTDNEIAMSGNGIFRPEASKRVREMFRSQDVNPDRKVAVMGALNQLDPTTRKMAYQDIFGEGAAMPYMWLGDTTDPAFHRSVIQGLQDRELIKEQLKERNVVYAPAEMVAQTAASEYMETVPRGGSAVARADFENGMRRVIEAHAMSQWSLHGSSTDFEDVAHEAVAKLLEGEVIEGSIRVPREWASSENLRALSRLESVATIGALTDAGVRVDSPVGVPDSVYRDMPVDTFASADGRGVSFFARGASGHIPIGGDAPFTITWEEVDGLLFPLFKYAPANPGDLILPEEGMDPFTFMKNRYIQPDLSQDIRNIISNRKQRQRREATEGED